MVASNYINNDIPHLKPSDSADRALNLMEEFKVSHLAIVFKDQYLGIISENILLNSFDTFGPISDFQLEHQNISLNPGSYLYDIIDTLVQNKLSIVPIINSKENFEGVITLDHIIKGLCELSAVKSPGTVIEILLKSTDYSLSEVSRIVESNGSKILSSFLRSFENDPNRVILSIKLNTERSSSVLAALERFQYNIVSTFHDDSDYNDDSDRLQQLFKYINT